MLVNTDVSQEHCASIIRVRELDLSFETEVMREGMWFLVEAHFKEVDQAEPHEGKSDKT
jgi:hypothetical protein